MADPLQITVQPQGRGIPQLLDENPYAAFDQPQRFADPIELNPRARDLIIRTIFGEDAARNDESRTAIGSVIRNRVQAGRYGATPEQVILKPWAFEPWMNEEATARMRGLRKDDPTYQSIANIVDQMFGGTLQDPTGGATHFYGPRAQAALRRSPPVWARGEPLASIGGHLFYAPDEPGRSSSPASRGGAATASLRTAAPPTATDAGPQAMAVAANPYAEIDAKAKPRGEFDAPAVPPSGANIPVEGPEQADIGRVGALGEGIKSGLSFGTSDELAGIHALGEQVTGKHLGAAFPLMTGIIGGVKAAIDAFRQNPSAENRAIAENAVAEARARKATADRQYPGTTLTGEILGGVAVPLPGGALTGAGRSIGTKIIGGAMQGATAGALTGAGTAQGGLEERAGSALQGGLVGGGLGAGVSAAMPAFNAMIGKALTGLTLPGVRAQADVAEAAAQAARTPPGTRVLPSQATGDTVVADLLGEPGQRLARAATNVSPTASAALKEFTMDRVREQYPRLVAFMETKFGPLSDNAIDQLKVKAEAAAMVSPLYQQAMNLHWQGVGSQRLLELVQGNSAVNKSAHEAIKHVTDRAVTERRAVPGVDSLEFWDQVKRQMDGRIAAAQEKAKKRGAGDVELLTNTKNQIVNELDRITGGTYAQAREVAAGFKGIGRAIDDAKTFVTTNKITAAEQANLMKSMTPEAQDAFRRAGINALMTRLSQKTDTHDLWKSVYNSRDAQQKMRLLFNGDQGLIREFEALHHVESVMERLRNAVVGNSTTAQQMLAAGMLGGALGGGLSSFDPTTTSGATALFSLGRYGQRAGAERVADHVAKLLMSNNPNAIDQVVKAAAGNATIMQMIRKMAQDAAVKTAGQQGVRNIGD